MVIVCLLGFCGKLWNIGTVITIYFNEEDIETWSLMSSETVETVEK